ncbi:MAG: DUF3943 domain-containing protein [Desulfuromonadaceae bacterium]|nr:DUF3943 domain-containing protein [Desulfuromonadaceae bacterium]MDD2856049.1 DUF3943 domain-containing protein [Desulfuromonadaceae bacterium]
MNFYLGHTTKCPSVLRMITVIFTLTLFFLTGETNLFAADSATVQNGADLSQPMPGDSPVVEESQKSNPDAVVIEEGKQITKSSESQGVTESTLENEKIAPAGETVATLPEPGKPVSEQRQPDWDGIFRDTGVVVGGQIVAVAITYVMPESFSAWTPEQKKAGFDKYKRNFVNPVMDKDKFYINYILHPYWGATYYIRARERGLNQAYSFAYSALLSAAYEFGVECIAEKPSIQDIFVTPIGGSLLGAYVFEPWRESIKSKPELRWYDHTALVLTDPLGLISLGFEKMFGIKSTIVVNVPIPQLQNRASSIAKNYLGATIQFPFN